MIPLQYLPMCAGMAHDAGLPYDEAWNAITVNPAKALDILDRVGTLEAGKDADIVIWDDDPMLVLGAKAAATIVNGSVVHNAEV